jgi:hypothetical protein
MPSNQVIIAKKFCPITTPKKLTEIEAFPPGSHQREAWTSLRKFPDIDSRSISTYRDFALILVPARIVNMIREGKDEFFMSLIG